MYKSCAQGQLLPSCTRRFCLNFHLIVQEKAKEGGLHGSKYEWWGQQCWCRGMELTYYWWWTDKSRRLQANCSYFPSDIPQILWEWVLGSKPSAQKKMRNVDEASKADIPSEPDWDIFISSRLWFSSESLQDCPNICHTMYLIIYRSAYTQW